VRARLKPGLIEQALKSQKYLESSFEKEQFNMKMIERRRFKEMD
jgi:hypothetical protein